MAASKVSLKKTGDRWDATEVNRGYKAINDNATITDKHAGYLTGIPNGKTVYDEFNGKGELPDFTNEVVGAVARPLTSRLSEELSVEDFRAEGDTDVEVWEKAITAMQSERIPLSYINNYNFNRHIIVGGSYWNVINRGGGVINSTSTQFAKISTNTQPDLTYPTPTNPAVLRGCAFYFTTIIYYSEFIGMVFTGFRFAIAFYQSPNTPFFDKCSFLYGNVGVICYQGCQNFYYKDCEATNSGAMHISSATCFPQGSPLSLDDNYYTDGLQIDNPINAFGFSEIQPSFDAWFISSILRPNTDSYVTGNNISKYPFDANHLYSQPTGRVVFIPMRTDRDIHGFTVKLLTIIGRVPRGFALVNGNIISLSIGATQAEGAWDQDSDTSIGLYTLGGASSGHIDQTRVNPSVLSHPLVVWTDRPYQLKDKYLDKTDSLYQAENLSSKLREAQEVNYGQPWLEGGVKVLKDRDYYVPIIEGAVFSQPNSTTLDVLCDPDKLFPLIKSGDIIQIGTNAFIIPTNYNSQKRSNDIRFSFNEGVLPVADQTPYHDNSASIYSSVYNNTQSAEPYVKNTQDYPYRRKVIIGYALNGEAYIQRNLNDDAPFVPVTAFQLTQQDILITQGLEPIVLTGATFSISGNEYKISKTGTDFTAHTDKVAFIFGNHKYENPYL